VDTPTILVLASAMQIAIEVEEVKGYQQRQVGTDYF
jgi:hypothetical protein